jgi:hypothetical protein
MRIALFLAAGFAIGYVAAAQGGVEGRSPRLTS